MTSITWAGPRYVQELGAFLGPENPTQRGCEYFIIQPTPTAIMSWARVLALSRLPYSHSWKCIDIVWLDVILKRGQFVSPLAVSSVQLPLKPVHTLYLVTATRAHAAMDRRWVTCTFCLGSVELWWRGPECLWCFIFHWVVCVVLMRNRNTNADGTFVFVKLHNQKIRWLMYVLKSNDRH